MPAPNPIGRYRLGRRLGAGGFAVVWLARDESLDTEVAIKVMAENWADRMDLRERFLTEARMLRRTASNRVVQVFDIGELPDGRPYFVMEFADLGTLADRTLAGPLPLVEALRMAAEVALGAAELHLAGIVHRDLKPSNVLIRSAPDGRERVLVGDLGVAKSLAQASSLTMSVGSAGYMAPEQAEPNFDVDVRADVYSLGALTYHLIAGEVPGPPGRVLTADRGLPEVPAPVRRVLRQALEPDRERRWPDAASLARRLRELADEVAAQPQLRRRRRRRVLLAAALGIVVLGMAGTGADLLVHRARAGSNNTGSNSTGGNSTGPTGRPTSPPATTSAASTPAVTEVGAQPTSTAQLGCPAGGPAVPSGAGTAKTADLDGDQKPDSIWLADQAGRRILGVRTASGARFEVTFTGVGPENATAVAGRLGDGSAVILLDLSRMTKVYAVAGCAIVPVRNAQGVQYTFDEGLTGYGSGAGCPVIGSSGRHLAGYLAKANSAGDSFQVTRTLVDLSDGGRRAANGARSTLGTGLPVDSPTVAQAQTITCGTGAPAVEPLS